MKNPLLLLTCSFLFFTGTFAQTSTLVKDINPGSASAQINDQIKVGSNILMMADNGSLGVELWITDGTSAGTMLVKDIYTGSGNGYPANFVRMGGNVYFRADHASYGFEIWKTDGTTAGTTLLKDVNPGTADGVYTTTTFDIVASNSMIFMPLDDGVWGRELWVSDGTSLGTTRLLDTYVGSIGAINAAGDPKEMTPFAGGILFSTFEYDLGTGTGNGRELWYSDGTIAGTNRIMDIHPGAGSSNPTGFTVVGPNAYFSADDGANGDELWVTDGTSGGTMMVKDINPTALSGSSPSNFVVVGSEIFFYADDGTNGKELWKTDGTPAGTVLVKDINPGASDSEVAPFGDVKNAVELNGKLVFVATESTVGRELWQSDGTAAGTTLLKDVFPGNLSSYASYFKVIGGRLFFYANDGTNGYELWASNGTTLGTKMIEDIYPGSSSSSANTFLNIGIDMIFKADNGSTGQELFSLDLSTITLPLPVELLDFSAVPAKDQMVSLNWTTATELNNDRFIVERSQNGTEFLPIASVKGVGTTMQAQQYTHQDTQPFEGKNYYRLRQVDMDGTENYSLIVEISVTSGTQFTAQWDQQNQTIQGWISGASTARGIQLIDIQGKEILSEELEQDSDRFSISLPGITPGLYFLQLSSGSSRLVQRILIW